MSLEHHAGYDDTPFPSISTNYGGINTDDVRMANPGITDPLMSSPCKARPDEHFAPCEFLSRPKNNTFCDSCRLALGGKGPSNATLKDAIMNGEIESTPLDDANSGGNVIMNRKINKLRGTKREKNKQCDFPGCQKKLFTAKYCYRHKCIVYSRERLYMKKHGCTAPIEYLHMPVKNNGGGKSNCAEK